MNIPTPPSTSCGFFSTRLVSGSFKNITRSGTREHNEKNSSTRKCFACHEKSDYCNCGTIKIQVLQQSWYQTMFFPHLLHGKELIMLKIIHTRMIPIPKPMAIINTVFNFPIKGTVAMASMGRSHFGSITSSKPKKLPNINPKNVEKIPAQLMIPARSMCLIL